MQLLQLQVDETSRWVGNESKSTLAEARHEIIKSLRLPGLWKLSLSASLSSTVATSGSLSSPSSSQLWRRGFFPDFGTALLFGCLFLDAAEPLFAVESFSELRLIEARLLTCGCRLDKMERRKGDRLTG